MVKPTDGDRPKASTGSAPEARRDQPESHTEVVQPGPDDTDPQKGVKAHSIDASGKRIFATSLIGKVSRDPQTNLITGSPMHPEHVKSAVEAEWRMGLKSVAQISRELGPSRNTIYTWAKDCDWPDRESAARSARERIDAEVVRQTVADLRMREPSTADNRSLEERLRELAATEGQPESVLKTDLVMADYSVAVALVIREQQRTGDQAIEIGRGLMEIFHGAVHQLRDKYRGGDELAKLKLLGGLFGHYATLVRALQIASNLQRQAYAIDAGQVRDPEEQGAKANPSGAGQQAQPRTYEDALREAEDRGEALQ